MGWAMNFTKKGHVTEAHRPPFFPLSRIVLAVHRFLRLQSLSAQLQNATPKSGPCACPSLLMPAMASALLRTHVFILIE